MLDFLDRLCRALTDRDADAILALLADPMAATLPPAVRAEAQALAREPLCEARAPLQAFVFAHRMAQLMASVDARGQRAGEPAARAGDRPSSPAPAATRRDSRRATAA